MMNDYYANIEEFAAYVAEHLVDFLPDPLKDAEIRFDRVTKNNDVTRISLTIRKESDKICPLLYLDGFYEMLKKTGNIDLVMEEIVKTFLQTDFQSFERRIRRINRLDDRADDD